VTRPLEHDPCDCCGCTDCPGGIPWDCPVCEIGTAEIDLSEWGIPDRTWVETVTQQFPFPQTTETEYTIKDFVRLRKTMCVGGDSDRQLIPVAEFCICRRTRITDHPVLSTPTPWDDGDDAIGTNGIRHQACKLMRVYKTQGDAFSYLIGLPTSGSGAGPNVPGFTGVDFHLHSAENQNPWGVDFGKCVDQTYDLADFAEPTTSTLAAPGPRIDAGKITLRPKCCTDACARIECVDSPAGFTCDCELPPTAKIMVDIAPCEWCWLSFFRDDIVAGGEPGYQAMYARVRWIDPPSPIEICANLTAGEGQQVLATAVAEIDTLAIIAPISSGIPTTCEEAFAENASAVTTQSVDVSMAWRVWGTNIYIDILFQSAGQWQFGFLGQAKLPCSAIESRDPIQLTRWTGDRPQADTCPPADYGDGTGLDAPAGIAVVAVEISDWCCGDPIEPPECLTPETFTPPCPSAAGWIADDSIFFPNPDVAWYCDNGTEAYIYDPVTNTILRVFLLPSGEIGSEPIQEPCELP